MTKDGVSYAFIASPTPGASYKVTFITLKDGILQLETETFTSASFRTKSGLIVCRKSGLVPGVTYRLQVVAVLGDVNSTATSVNFTTQADGEPWQLYWH